MSIAKTIHRACRNGENVTHVLKKGKAIDLQELALLEAERKS